MAGARHSDGSQRSDSDEPEQQTKWRAKKPRQVRARQPTYLRDEINLALADWLRETEGGAWGDDEIVCKIQDADTAKNHPFPVLLDWVNTVKQLRQLGPADDTTPPATRMQKMTNIAVSHFLSKSIGWVQGVLRTALILEVYAQDPHLQKFLESVEEEAGGMKTLEKALNNVIDAPADLLRKARPSASGAVPEVGTSQKAKTSTSSACPGAAGSRVGKPSVPSVAGPSARNRTSAANIGSSAGKGKKRARSKEEDEEQVGQSIEPDYGGMTYQEWDDEQEEEEEEEEEE